MVVTVCNAHFLGCQFERCLLSIGVGRCVGFLINDKSGSRNLSKVDFQRHLVEIPVSVEIKFLLKVQIGAFALYP